ncbi:AAA family ATPase [Ornithinimicrobium pekingense]|uniref:AAA domain-containing protein n=1 Tax=Ornithinimicrobium pekingense TaxID=384677 RepID=A0ABQ2F8C5_9MICO|nr:AAA family ATPase [Ornithinimicrobium pekingense]GGK68674.1 hypothetical protein GCM10011509_16360 [Ornithinimicrobium pekingense]
MTAVILVSESTDLVRRVRLATDDNLLVLTRHQLPAGPAQLLALTEEPEEVRTVLVDADGDAELANRTLELAGKFEQQFPTVSLLLITQQAEQLALSALRAGVKDLMSPQLDVEEFRWAIRRASEITTGRSSSGAPADSFGGRVITVASPKGGVGKTTLATNIAMGLTQQSPQGTVLIDLDIQFGDVAAALDLDPVYTLSDVVSGPSAQDPIALKALLTAHPSGLHVLPGVKSPAEADHIGAAQIATLIASLKQEFRFVVIDTAPGMSEETLAAMDHTTDLVLITSLDVPGVRGLRKELELLGELELTPATRHIVVNMAEKGGGLAVPDVEATIGASVDLVLPRSMKVMRSTNEGSPIVESQPRDPLSRELVQLVHRFSPATTRSAWLGHRARGRR